MRTIQGTMSPLLILVGLAGLPGGQILAGDEVEKALRIGVGHFHAETCTFCPRPTTIADFEAYGSPTTGDAVFEALSWNEYIKGFLHGAKQFNGVEVEGIYAVNYPGVGSFGSWVTPEAFDRFAGTMAERFAQAEDLDCIYLSLHGGMAVTGIPRPEAELVRRIREQMGDDIPIIGTFDLHGNEDRELGKYMDVALVTKRYPHYDDRLQGERAARVLVQMMRGNFKPTMVIRKPGVITPSVVQWTGAAPARDIMARATRWEEDNADVFVSVFFGFAYADVPDAGAAVVVVTNDDQALAEEIAADMSNYIWRLREQFAGQVFPDAAEGARRAIAAAKAGKRLVVIADHADRSGNSTHILEQLIEQQSQNFFIAALADPRALEILLTQGRESGEEVTLKLGGYADKFAGNPVTVTGTLDYIGPFQSEEVTAPTVAVINIGNNNRIALTPEYYQAWQPDVFDGFHVDIESTDILVVKSRVHFRRGFEDTGLAKAIIVVDAPGWGPADLSTLEYRNVSADIYPLSEH